MILSSGLSKNEFSFPGEPMIYSIKYSVGMRRKTICSIRNKKLFAHLKCLLPAYTKDKTPVILSVVLFVTPFPELEISQKDVKSEKIPAVYSYELCDYLLSLLEMIKGTLFKSYQQVVHIDIQKFYSAEPRTVFKFMKWDHYVNSQDSNSDNPKTKSKRKVSQSSLLQSECTGNEKTT